nr:replication protein A 70 kDa DNA-binding subunit B-like [Ipomoea batatas]
MWGNFTVCQGVEIDKELQSVDYPVVLGRRITVTPYQGISLSTRMDSGVEENPFRKRAEALKECSDSRRPQLRLPLPPTSLRSDFDDFSLSITKINAKLRLDDQLESGRMDVSEGRYAE